MSNNASLRRAGYARSRRPRGRSVRAAAGRAARGHGGARLCRAPARRRSGQHHQPGRAGAPAGAAQIRAPCPAQGRPAVRRLCGGLPGSFARLFTSPGPIFEPEGTHADPWRGARALFAVGFRPGDVVLNTFSYHLTPGGFIFDASARALGCAVIPAGPGNTEAQFELIEAYRPVGYSGTPDFLKILLDAAAKRRARRLLDQARAGFGRGISEIAAGRDESARRRRLSGIRHRRSRHGRLRDHGARRAWSSTKT